MLNKFHNNNGFIKWTSSVWNDSEELEETTEMKRSGGTRGLAPQVLQMKNMQTDESSMNNVVESNNTFNACC